MHAKLMRKLIPVLIAAMWVTCPPLQVKANPYTQLVHQLMQGSRQRWMASTAAQASQTARSTTLLLPESTGSAELGRARQAARSEYLAKLLPAMRLSSAVSHLPREHPIEVDEKQNWTKYYDLAKRRLRPRVEYVWVSDATNDSDTITLSEQHVSLLRENFDIVMWYRKELQAIADSQLSATASSFGLFLDHIIAGVMKGMPAPPKINLSKGTINRSEWRLNEKQLREQIVMLYRYLSAKYQIYPEYEQFAAADLALLSAWTKLATLMGAQLNDGLFQDMRVDLMNIDKQDEWKRPLAEAFVVLQRRAEIDDMNMDNGMPDDSTPPELAPTVIRIPPPRPKKKSPTKSKPAPDDETVLEIIVRQKR